MRSNDTQHCSHIFSSSHMGNYCIVGAAVLLRNYFFSALHSFVTYFFADLVGKTVTQVFLKPRPRFRPIHEFPTFSKTGRGQSRNNTKTLRSFFPLRGGLPECYRIIGTNIQATIFTYECAGKNYAPIFFNQINVRKQFLRHLCDRAGWLALVSATFFCHRPVQSIPCTTASQ